VIQHLTKQEEEKLKGNIWWTQTENWQKTKVYNICKLRDQNGTEKNIMNQGV